MQFVLCPTVRKVLKILLTQRLCSTKMSRETIHRYLYMYISENAGKLLATPCRSTNNIQPMFFSSRFCLTCHVQYGHCFVSINRIPSSIHPLRIYSSEILFVICNKLIVHDKHARISVLPL